MTAANPPTNGKPIPDRTAEHQDVYTGIFCMLYLLFMLGFFAWFMFDTWVGAHTVAGWFRYNSPRLDTPAYRLMVYAVLGGALGGAVNGIRSIVEHYHKFDKTYVWKYITGPWLGSTLGFFVYAILQSGIAAISGVTSSSDAGTAQALTNFSIGMLSGYGARDAFIWLDNKVENIFSTRPKQEPPPEPEPQPEPEASAKIAAKDAAEAAETPTNSGAPAEMLEPLLTVGPAATLSADEPSPPLPPTDPSFNERAG